MNILQKTDILGVKIDLVSREQATKAILEKIEKEEKFWVVTPNPEFVVVAQKDKEFKNILNKADLSLPDGFGLVLASRILGVKPLKERVSGADIVGDLLDQAAVRHWKIGIVGSRRGKKEEIKTLINKLQVLNNPYRVNKLQIEAQELTPDWERNKYDLIFACQGMGKQERWIRENHKKIDASLFMGVGGSLDFYAGFVKRAPEGIRQLGFEWAWRLTQEPAAHLKRVWIAVVIFMWLVIKKKIIQKN